MLLVLSRSYIHLMSEYSSYLNPLTVLISGPSVRSEHVCAFLIVDFAPGMICWYLCSTVSWDILYCHGDPALMGGVTGFLQDSAWLSSAWGEAQSM